MEGRFVEKCLVVLEGDEASWRGEGSLGRAGGDDEPLHHKLRKTLKISLMLTVSSDQQATRAVQERFNHKCQLLTTSHLLPKV